MSSPAEILAALRARYPGMESRPVDPAPQVTVPPEGVRQELSFLRGDLGFDFLVFVTALDRPAEAIIELVYRLFSYSARVSVVVRVRVPRDGGRVPSVSDLYRTAEWHERETAELFGVEFSGHPDPRRLLLPDDLEGFPLRKDFTHPNLRRLPEVIAE
ncbi:MAG TPA: NADH-quinone oxidoreductase subunit C [Spirochaetia bacterium]|nr:NADH-quinone oxidoreductase subunit C [Spirochaetia bacterium]